MLSELWLRAGCIQIGSPEITYCCRCRDSPAYFLGRVGCWYCCCSEQLVGIRLFIFSFDGGPPRGLFRRRGGRGTRLLRELRRLAEAAPSRRLQDPGLALQKGSSREGELSRMTRRCRGPLRSAPIACPPRQPCYGPGAIGRPRPGG